jgi:Xaa-Pro aminopeptidase
MFPISTYLERRNRLKAQFGSGLLLFLGNEESPMNYADNPFPFRQDSSFLYYFGVDQAGFAAIIDLDADRTVIFGNDITLDDIVWTGVLPSVAELAARAGVAETAPVSTLDAFLKKAMAQGRVMKFLPPYRAENKIKLSQLLNIPIQEQPEKASVEFLRAVVEMRVIKSHEEIAEIEKAVDITIDMHLAAIRLARPGLKEAEIAAWVTEVA